MPLDTRFHVRVYADSDIVILLILNDTQTLKSGCSQPVKPLEPFLDFDSAKPESQFNLKPEEKASS